MASMKRGRDFGTSFEQQLKAFRPVTGARQESAYTSPADTTVNAAVIMPSLTEPCTCCTHCGCGLSELQVQQCHACKNVYCSSCSVPNYDAREDRVFCLDCHPHYAASCSDHDDYDMDCTQYNAFGYDRSPGSDRGFHRSSVSRTNVMQACSRAAAAAASLAATTPFSCFGASHQSNCGLMSGSALSGQTAGGWSGSSVSGAVLPGSAVAGASWKAMNAAKSSSRGFGFSRENVFGDWNAGSPQTLRSADAGQMLQASSAVIPFVGTEGYCSASRALEAAVTGC